MKTVKIALMILLMLLIQTPVYCADYTIEPIDIKTQSLDDVSDAYKITVSKGKYRVKNSMDKNTLNIKLHSKFYKYKKLMWLTGGLILIFVAPEFVVGVAALAEAQQYIQTNAVLNKGATVKVIVPDGQPLQLEKVNTEDSTQTNNSN